MTLYPVTLNVEGWPCLVVGGGAIGFARAERLNRAGATLVIVSPAFDPEFDRLMGAERRERKFEESDLQGMRLAVAATNDPRINDTIARACEGRAILCNVVDGSSRGRFSVPAVVERGSLQVAVSTGGAAPALAGALCAWLEDRLPADTEKYVAFLAEARARAKEELHDDSVRSRLARRLASKEGYETFHEMDEHGRRKWLDTLIEAQAAVGQE